MEGAKHWGVHLEQGDEMIKQIDESTNLFIKNIHMQSNVDSDLFRQSFEKALAGTGTSGKNNLASVSSLKEISSKEWPMNNRNLSLEDKTDKLLKSLDDYSLQLQNNKISLKKIEPFLQGIKDSAANLLEETASAVNTDTAIKNIAKQCAVTANTEYLKFQRGDYI